VLLKKLTLVILPGAGVLYFIIGVIFDFKWMVYVLGIILALTLYLGILVVLSTRYDGRIIITTSEEGKRIFTLELDIDPDDILEKDTIIFDVVSELEIRNINMPYNGN